MKVLIKALVVLVLGVAVAGTLMAGIGAANGEQASGPVMAAPAQAATTLSYVKKIGGTQATGFTIIWGTGERVYWQPKFDALALCGEENFADPVWTACQADTVARYGTMALLARSLHRANSNTWVR